jgi:hypothetical protein
MPDHAPAMKPKITVKSISGSVTLMATLIIVTPLCGLIFLCGCDWPWSGLDVRCNFYRPDEEHQCPWCASLVTGLLSTGLAISCGVLTAMVPTFSLATHNSVIEMTVRTLTGLMLFVLTAILTGGLAAYWQHYPIGVGGILDEFLF